MRTMLGILAACLLGLAAPASAALVQLGISGTVSGQTMTIMCPPGSSLGCLTAYPGGTKKDPYQSDFSLLLIPMELKQGVNSFSYGMLRSGGLWTGTFNNDNGVLTGLDIAFNFETGDFPRGVAGAYSTYATAKSFTIAPVPEPATWALMLVGFLVIGSALRHQPRRRALVPATA